MNKLKRFFTASMLAIMAFTALVPTGFADSISGSSNGTVNLKLDINPDKAVEYQDVSFTVSTVDGSDISDALDGYDVGFQILSDTGVNKLQASLLVGEHNSYRVIDSGDSYQIVLNVDQDDQLDSNSVQMPVGLYHFKLGDRNNSGGFASVFASGQFSVVETVYGNIDWSAFFQTFSNSTAKPSSVEIVPEVVQQNGDVYIVAFADAAKTKTAALPEGWDIGIWYLKSQGNNGFFPVFTIEYVAQYSEGDFTAYGQDDGVFVVPADFDPRAYSVSLYDENHQIVGESANLEVTLAENLQAFADDIGAAGTPGSNLDPSSFVEEEASVDGEVAADANVAAVLDVNIPDFIFDHADLPNPGLATAVCADIDENFWGYNIIVSLLEDNLFPVMIGEDRSASCRVETEVKRKEFTYWLLQAYQSGSLDDIEEFHNNYNYDNSPFTDVDGSDAYDPYIIMAAQLGIVNGNPDGTFRGDAVINRAEVLKILLRSAEIFTADSAELEALAEAQYDSYEPQKKFADEDKDQWYTPYLHYAAVKNIIEGRKYQIGSKAIVKSDMSAGVKYGEAGKILYYANKLAVDGDASL